MNQKFKNQSIANIFLCLLLFLFVGLGCGVMKNPLRDYSPKPFNSSEWLKGDAIERGRMAMNVVQNHVPDGKSKEDVKNLFGEPDRKATVEGKEVWLYRADLGNNQELPYLPVSFDNKNIASVGSAKGGTWSMLVGEDELK